MAQRCLTAFVRLMLVSFAVQNVQETNSKQPFVASVTIPPSIICTRIKGLSSKQMRFCEKYPDTMDSISKGYQLGVEECKFQFRKRRWNCTSLGSKSPFSRRAVPGTKEDAFTHAIISAGIAHSVTLACTEGNITRCGCDRSLNGAKSVGGWSWGGCSVNIQRGLQVADEFLNGQDPGRSDIALMSKHNNEVGREVLKESVKIECRCMGPSASCVTKYCWDSLASFREVGDKIYHRVVAAQHVRTRKIPSRDGLRDENLVLDIDEQEVLKPRPSSLVYLERSPTYCEPDYKNLIMGTAGRICNRTALHLEADNCSLLCCGRGYDTHESIKHWKCFCRFIWCCKVKCKRCKKHVEVTRCK